jgi:ATP-binding cassette subfamily C (CFTR/MRP) protein 4
MAVSGELPLSGGSMFCGGHIAYSAQQPWVFSASIRQNVLFGKEYEEERYHRVLQACALNQVKILPISHICMKKTI